jgi:alpha-amylase/alpha-mannosidase (GH57 family)
MEPNYSTKTEINNKNIPETMRAELLKVQEKISELEKIILWLRNYPGEKEYTIRTLNRLSRIVREARKGIREVDENYPEVFREDIDRAFMTHLQSYCTKLWVTRVSFDLYESR